MVRQKYRKLKSSMDKRMRRLRAGAEADAIGRGGIKAVAQANGLAISTVILGRNEVRAGVQTDNLVKVRRNHLGHEVKKAVNDDPSLDLLVGRHR
jgi:hypothetical protein